MAELTTYTPTVGDAAVAHSSRRGRALKRGLDLVGGSILLVLAAVPMAGLALLVKVTSRGPIVFKQERVGRDGRSFVILKFRTMVNGMYDDVRNDRDLWREYVEHDFKLPPHLARLTSVGSLLRKLSLDELPQLINIIKGDMGLVGVRPVERAQFEARGATSQALYTTFRPGLTGLWQVEGRSDVQHDHRVELDDTYVLTWAPWADVRLLARTPLAVLRMRRSV